MHLFTLNINVFIYCMSLIMVYGYYSKVIIFYGIVILVHYFQCRTKLGAMGVYSVGWSLHSVVG